LWLVPESVDLGLSVFFLLCVGMVANCSEGIVRDAILTSHAYRPYVYISTAW